MRRVAVIGLDGVPWKVVNKLHSDGVIKHLAELREEGAHGHLASTIPPFTVPAWTSMSTGVNPGKHGAYATHALRSDYSLRLLTSRDVHYPRVYEILTISLLFTLELAFGFLSKLVLKMGDIYQRVLNVEDLLARFETSIIDIIVERPIIDPLKEALVGLVGIKVTGILFFIIWFLVIIYSLNMISKALERIIDLQWEDQVKAAFKNPVRGFFTGFTITFLVGSSSIGTSLIIPFIATKVVDLKGAYPYLVGCNIATTMDLSQIYGYIAGGLTGFILGTAHIVLNIMAVILWFVSPLRFVPIKIAEAIGSRIAGNKNAALSLVLWIIGVFFVVPILVIVFMG